MFSVECVKKALRCHGLHLLGVAIHLRVDSLAGLTNGSALPGCCLMEDF